MKKTRVMLTSAPGALVKKTNIEILHQELLKNGMFNFLKVKTMLFSSKSQHDPKNKLQFSKYRTLISFIEKDKSN